MLKLSPVCPVEAHATWPPCISDISPSVFEHSLVFWLDGKMFLVHLVFSMPQLWNHHFSKIFHSLFVCLRQGIIPSPRLECSNMIVAHCSLDLLDSDSPPTAASQVAGTTGMHHHAQLNFVFLVEVRFHHVGQAFWNSWPQLICLPQPSKVLGL